MKFNIEVDVKPAEIRELLGLPDFEPVQDLLVERLKEQVESGLDGTLMANMVKSMVQGGVQSVEIYQKFFSELLHRGERKSASGSGTGSDGRTETTKLRPR